MSSRSTLSAWPRSRRLQIEEAFALVRRAYPFRDLTREEFDDIVLIISKAAAHRCERQYSGLFGKIAFDDGMISLAHPRVAREFLVNIGTIVSERFVDVLLRRRRLGSVEENFIKQLHIGDLFVLGGRVVRLIDTGVQEAHVERADGHLPTIPRWNAAKMPLTSGVARGVRQLRTNLADATAQGIRTTPCHAIGWSRITISPSRMRRRSWNNFRAQESISEIPVGRKMLIELYRDDTHSHYFFHSLIGRSANDALSRIVAWRVKKRIGGNALVTIDDYGFLLTLRRFQELPLEEWRGCFARAGAEDDLRLALRGSELVKWQFRGVAQTGLMVPRNLPGRERKRKQMNWSAEVLFRVLEQHEPHHPLLRRSLSPGDAHLSRCGSGLRISRTRSEISTGSLRELPVVSPFSFPIYASMIKESMMLEDPASALERIYLEMYAKVESVKTAAKDAA